MATVIYSLRLRGGVGRILRGGLLTTYRTQVLPEIRKRLPQGELRSSLQARAGRGPVVLEVTASEGGPGLASLVGRVSARGRRRLVASALSSALRQST